MAYSDFTLIKFKTAFQIETASESLFQPTMPLFEVGSRLKEDLYESRSIPLSTAKAKSELLIAPLLKELKRKNAHFSFFSGFVFNVDAQRGLTGIPDFIFSSSDDRPCVRFFYTSCGSVGETSSAVTKPSRAPRCFLCPAQ